MIANDTVIRENDELRYENKILGEKIRENANELNKKVSENKEAFVKLEECRRDIKTKDEFIMKNVQNNINRENGRGVDVRTSYADPNFPRKNYYNQQDVNYFNSTQNFNNFVINQQEAGKARPRPAQGQPQNTLSGYYIDGVNEFSGSGREPPQVSYTNNSPGGKSQTDRIVINGPVGPDGKFAVNLKFRE